MVQSGADKVQREFQEGYAATTASTNAYQRGLRMRCGDFCKVPELVVQNAELLEALRRLVRWGQEPLACPDCGKVEDCLPDCSFEHAVAVIAKGDSDDGQG